MSSSSSRFVSSRYGSDDFGLIPSWAIAEALRRVEARRRAEAARMREADERRNAVLARRRLRRERLASFFGSLRPTGSNGPAEA